MILFPSPQGSRPPSQALDLALATQRFENTADVVGLREGAWLRVEGATITLEGSAAARLFRRGQPPVEYPSGSRLDFLLDRRGTA